jgi:hypothetical protein
VQILTVDEIQAANDYGESLRQVVDGQTLPGDLRARARASAACLSIAQEHHHGIVELLASSLYPSAFALVRPMFEAYIRGEWLALCATDNCVKRFMDGKDPPSPRVMVEALEATEGFESKRISTIRNASWDALCGFTHTGGNHVQRWQSGDAIEPCYQRTEVLEVLRFAEIILTLSVAGVLKQSGDETAAETLKSAFRARFGCSPAA